MRARAPLIAALSLALVLACSASAEVRQRGSLRVSFEAKLTPSTLPRSGSAPVDVSVGGRISTTNGEVPPQLRKIAIAVNRSGHIAPGSVPRCRIEQIQPASTAGALEACGPSLVGRGTFTAKVLLPTQSPFPSKGEVYAFNGIYEGHPAILAHVYGTAPAPTSYTLPFLISPAKGTFGTVLSASLPQVTSEWGYVTGLGLRLERRLWGGRSYATAGCPAPAGFPGASFSLARTTFSFAGGTALSATLTRSCRARG